MTHDFRKINQQVIDGFRNSGGVGEIGPVHFDRLVLLTTTRRRSGARHTVPLGAARDEEGNLLLFASNMAAPRDPDWLRNLRADPRVTVEITGATFEARAEILDGAERDDAYQRWVEMAPHTADHERKAGRPIPMVRIRRPETATT